MANRNTVGLLGYEEEHHNMHLPLTPSPVGCIEWPSNSASLFWVCRLGKLWGLLDGISSMVKWFQKLFQTVVPGLPKKATAKR